MNNSQNNSELSSSGFCTSCNTIHSLRASIAVPHCHSLMNQLDEFRRIDFDSCESKPDPSFSTDYLFGEARGQMFGVMVYMDAAGKIHTAKAFSGQYNGKWKAGGWVPPIIDVKEFDELTSFTERKIKSIGREMAKISKGTPEYHELGLARKKLSRELMRKIHAIYRIKNFNGETRTMPEIVNNIKGIPTGTGDCCAPKLLNYAARNNLTPISIAEFYYGKENRSGTKIHKNFYPSCSDKCGLILGYMLCGLNELSS